MKMACKGGTITTTENDTRHTLAVQSPSGDTSAKVSLNSEEGDDDQSNEPCRSGVREQMLSHVTLSDDNSTRPDKTEPSTESLSASGTAGARPKRTMKQDNDVKEFLEVMKNHTLQRIQYDICGKRKSLKKLTKHTQPKLMIVNMDGKKSKGIDARSATDKRGKQAPVGTDISETELSDIHKKHGESEVRHVLLLAAAGEGKTTTVKRYALLVSNENEHIKLVLYIPLSNVDTKDSTPFDLLVTKQLGRLSKRLKLAGKKWLEENPNKTMVIFDGFDQSKFSLQHCSAETDHETSTGPEVIIANILTGHIYSGMKILSTSRWHSFLPLRNDLKPDRIIALRGFSELLIKDVFQQLLGSSANSVLHHLQENAPDLLPLCSTPNILLNTTSVLSQSSEIHPETQTAILTHVVIYLLRPANLRNTDPNLVVKLSKLAYNSIKDDIFVFKPIYLRKFGLQISDIHDFTITDAILVSDQSLVQESDQRCCFYHQTIQEFFAALHICFENTEFRSLLKSICEDDKMENVLIFLSGILAHDKTFKIVQDKVLDVEIPINQMRKLLAETICSILQWSTISNVKVCKVLQECDKNFVETSTANVTSIMINDIMEPRDSFVVSSVASKLTNLDFVRLRNLELNPFTIRVLAGKLNSLKHFAVYWLTLDSSLSDQHKSSIAIILIKSASPWITLNCGDDVARFSLGCVQGSNVHGIETSHNKNLEHATYRLISSTASSDIYVDNNDLQDQDVKQLLAGVKESGAKVKQLVLNENKNITEQGFSSVAEFIAQGQTKRIFLHDCSLNGKKMKALHDGLEGHKLEIELISINRNKTLEPEAFQYIPGIIAVGRVQNFQMKYCGLTTEKLEVIEKHARAHKNTKVLCFGIGGETSIQPAGYRIVLNILQHFSVKFLGVMNCGLTAEELGEMADHALRNKITLYAICIDGNKNIGSDGFKLLVDFMQHVCLRILQMIDCDLDPEKLKAMADQAEGKQLQLKELIANDNQNIGPDGCKHLVDFLKQTMIEVLSLQNCGITSNMLKNLVHQLKSSHIKLKGLVLSQNAPDAAKEYLPSIYELFHCVSIVIKLEKWRFSDEDRRLLKAELQKCPFQDLKVYITDDFGNLIILAKEYTDTPSMEGAASGEDSPNQEKESTRGLSGMLGLFRRFLRRNFHP